MKREMSTMLRQLFGLTLAIATVIVSANAEAKTVYTSLQETIVRDKPIVLGSSVIFKLPAGSMLETVKQVGAFTAVSFIADGKVKTGFIANSQLNPPDSKAGSIGAVEAAQTGIGAEDVGAMVNGLSEVDPATTAAAKVNQLKASTLPPGSEDPGALLTAKLDGLQIPSTDLATFAKNGKLVERKPKAKVVK
jgi:hypothetical protein